MTESIIDQLHSELKISTFDAEKLIPDPENVRRHGERNHDAVIRSIKRFGVRKPIVAHEGTHIVYAGNETLLCCLELGITRIPVAWIPKPDGGFGLFYTGPTQCSKVSTTNRYRLLDKAKCDGRREPFSLSAC